MVSDFLLCDFGADFDRQYRARVGAAASKRQELPHGAAMSLGEFQEDMRVGESLPVSPGAQRQTRRSPHDQRRNQSRVF
jgi:hypothetical protein